jgi:hypothetical protein
MKQIVSFIGTRIQAVGLILLVTFLGVAGSMYLGLPGFAAVEKAPAAERPQPITAPPAQRVPQGCAHATSNSSSNHGSCQHAAEPAAGGCCQSRSATPSSCPAH